MEDRDRIFDNIESESPKAAVLVDSRIEEQVNRLAQYTEFGRPGRVEDTRELVIGQTPYIAPYCSYGGCRAQALHRYRTREHRRCSLWRAPGWLQDAAAWCTDPVVGYLDQPTPDVGVLCVLVKPQTLVPALSNRTCRGTPPK